MHSSVSRAVVSPSLGYGFYELSRAKAVFFLFVVLQLFSLAITSLDSVRPSDRILIASALTRTLAGRFARR